jgi:hypothetical protein
MEWTPVATAKDTTAKAMQTTKATESGTNDADF